MLWQKYFVSFFQDFYIQIQFLKMISGSNQDAEFQLTFNITHWVSGDPLQ